MSLISSRFSKYQYFCVFVLIKNVLECLIIRNLSGNKLLIVLITFPLFISSALNISSAYTVSSGRSLFVARESSRLGLLSFTVAFTVRVSSNLQGMC